MKQDGQDSANSIEHCASNRLKENTIDVALESPDVVSDRCPQETVSKVKEASHLCNV